MDLVRFDLSTDAEKLRACYDLYQAAKPVDEPDSPPLSLAAFGGWRTFPSAHGSWEAWLVPGDAPGGWAASCMIRLPATENTHLMNADLLVHPACRRAGLGRELLAHATGRARAHGRTLLRGDATEGSAGDAFGAAVGADRGMLDVRRMVELSTVPAERLARLREEATAAAVGYSVLSWTGPTPEKYLDQAAQVGSAIADAPHNPGSQTPVWDGARVREEEALMAHQKSRVYTVGAVCDRTGELAALCILRVDPEYPQWGHQDLTAVAREHRGHRLGLLVKLALQDLLAEAEPSLTRIETYNAAANDHMIAINEALGFRVLDRSQTWQLDLAAR